MPFYIVENDITRMRVDAVVNAANTSLLGGGGVDGAIHRRAGPELLEYCRTLGGCQVGEAKLSPGFQLPARWIIHTVGPVWRGGDRGEADDLAACYRNALSLALAHGFETVAFPLISGGAFGYPKEQALEVAVREIRAFLEDHELSVWLVLYDRSSCQLSKSLMTDVRSYLDENYVGLCCGSDGSIRRGDRNSGLSSIARPEDYGRLSFSTPPAASAHMPAPMAAPASPKPEKHKRLRHAKMAKPEESVGSFAPMPSGLPTPSYQKPLSEEAFAVDLDRELDRRLKTLDESFSQMLLRKIDEKGITDAACYKKANVDRKLFSKIRSDVHYRPSKPTAIAFAIALELSLEETRELLMKAGYALSRSNQFDVIIEFFLSRGNYNIFEINETLFAFDQNLLGA